MNKRRIPMAGLLATVVAAATAVQLNGQNVQPAADLTNAALAEVRNAQGQIILSGQFRIEEDDDDVERKAALAPTGIVADAAGAVEIEYRRTAPARQEVEFSVRNVAPGTMLTFVIDGTEVATATVDRRGRGKVELDVRMPGTTGSR